MYKEDSYYAFILEVSKRARDSTHGSSATMWLHSSKIGVRAELELVTRRNLEGVENQIARAAIVKFMQSQKCNFSSTSNELTFLLFHGSA